MSVNNLKVKEEEVPTFTVLDLDSGRATKNPSIRRPYSSKRGRADLE